MKNVLLITQFCATKMPGQYWNCHLLSDLWALFWNKTLKHLWLNYQCFAISSVNHIWYTRLPPWKLESVWLHWFPARILRLVSQGRGVCQATALCRTQLLRPTYSALPSAAQDPVERLKNWKQMGKISNSWRENTSIPYQCLIYFRFS